MSRKTRINVDSILIEQLAIGASQTEAARAAGCTRRTVHRRLQDPEFRLEVREFRESLLDAGAGKLASSLGESIDRLKHLMTTATPDAAQVAAARAIGDLTIKFKGVEFEQRIAELERRVADANRNSLRGPAGLIGRQVIGKQPTDREFEARNK